VCIQLFRENFDVDVPFNIRQSRGKCFDDILSRAPRRDYANRKIEDIKKNKQRPAKLTEPQRRKSKAFFLVGYIVELTLCVGHRKFIITVLTNKGCVTLWPCHLH
jgi:hypothetical protein